MASQTIAQALPKQKPRSGRMLTVSGTARMMSVHPNSVRRWADMGLLRSYRVGLRGDRRFYAEDVIDFLDSYESYKGNGSTPSK